MPTKRNINTALLKVHESVFILSFVRACVCVLPSPPFFDYFLLIYFLFLVLVFVIFSFLLLHYQFFNIILYRIDKNDRFPSIDCLSNLFYGSLIEGREGVTFTLMMSSSTNADVTPLLESMRYPIYTAILMDVSSCMC